MTGEQEELVAGSKRLFRGAGARLQRRNQYISSRHHILFSLFTLGLIPAPCASVLTTTPHVPLLIVRNPSIARDGR